MSMGERLEQLRSMRQAISSTDSIMEKAAVLATCRQVSGAMTVPEVVAAASLMGGRLDDCLDKSNRNHATQAVQAGQWRVREIADGDLWHKYVLAWKDLIDKVNNSLLDDENRNRVIRNSVIFFRNVRHIEMFALGKNDAEWNLDASLNYRKAICLMWSEYFSSLSPDTDLELELIDSPEPRQVLESRKKLLVENSFVANLYYGSVVYQLICDWTGRRTNNDNKIPGLGSLGSSNLQDNMAWKIIEEHIRTAKENGAIGKLESIFFRHVLPSIRNIANKRLSISFAQ